MYTGECTQVVCGAVSREGPGATAPTSIKSTQYPLLVSNATVPRRNQGSLEKWLILGLGGKVQPGASLLQEGRSCSQNRQDDGVGQACQRHAGAPGAQS